MTKCKHPLWWLLRTPEAPFCYLSWCPTCGSLHNFGGKVVCSPVGEGGSTKRLGAQFKKLKAEVRGDGKWSKP